MGQVRHVLEVFYTNYLTDKIPVIPLDAYIREVESQPSFSVLNDSEKKMVSLKYGIKSNFNLDGKIYTDQELQEFLLLRRATYKRQFRLIDDKIRERLLDLRNPEYGIISKDILMEKLNDQNLPISDKERDILCHLSEINGYEYLTDEQLAIKYNMSSGSLKRRYQRAILSILQYENNKKMSQISYDKDIVPIEKYFSNYDRKILKMYYHDKMTMEQIGKEIGLSMYQTGNLVSKLRICIAEILTNSETAKKFDFDSAREVICSNDFYLGANHDILIQMYRMIHGEENYHKHTAKEVQTRLGLNVENSSIFRWVYKVMIEIEKYKLGIQHKRVINRKAVEQFYLDNKDNLSVCKRNVFIRYLSKKRKIFEMEERIPVDIIYEVLKTNEQLVFHLCDKTREDMKYLIINSKIYLPKNTISDIKLYYNISEREVMNGKDKLKVFKLLMPLYQKKLTDSSKCKIKN